MTTYDNVFDLTGWPDCCRVPELSHGPLTILSAHRLADLVDEPISETNIQEVERLARGISEEMMARL